MSGSLGHEHPSLQLHQCLRNNWTASTYSNIHWPAFYRSFKKRKLTSQLRIQKFSNGWLPVGRIRHRINPDQPDSCPSCLGRNETCDHIMRCRERRRADLHSSQLDELDDHLDKTKTPCDLASAIIRGIKGWYRDPNAPPKVQSPPSKYSSPKGTQRSKRYWLGSHVLRPNLPGLPNSA